MIVATIWMGCIGFLDDYRKAQIPQQGRPERKIQSYRTGRTRTGGGNYHVALPSIVMSENTEVMRGPDHSTEIVMSNEQIKSPQTTIPFVKNNNFNYQWLTSWVDNKQAAETLGWLAFVLVVIIVVAAVSNGANLTDGLDGLCAGTSAIIGIALLIMAYLGGNVIYSSYLNIMYIPGSEEMVIYASAFIGALVGFLWYNAFPAQVFMGDTGSLTLGGILAVFAILIRKELLIPLLCLVFFLEDLSVMMQVAYFKYTKNASARGAAYSR